MFFPERIKNIKKTDKVLDVGPGYTPFYRSDVLLEKIFDDEAVALKQTGSSQKKDLKKKIVYFKDEAFPFSDNEFDYVICSHVLEHIPKNEIEKFISELSRVASQGYIEVPLYTFELITAVQCHVNLIHVDKNHTIHFLSKENIDLTCVSYTQLRELFIRLNFNGKIIPLNLEVFGHGFEFQEKIDYTIHPDAESFFELVHSDSEKLDLRWCKDYRYYIDKVMYQFKKNIFKQKVYSGFGVLLK